MIKCWYHNAHHHYPDKFPSGCTRGADCRYDHSHLMSKTEFDEMARPRAKTPSGAASRGTSAASTGSSGKGKYRKKGKGKGKRDLSAERKKAAPATGNTDGSAVKLKGVCQIHLLKPGSCPGQKNGSCQWEHPSGDSLAKAQQKAMPATGKK